MGKTDWDVVTNYSDVVTTTLKTVTFPKVQEQVYLRNQGNANFTYTIGSQSGTLTPGQSVTVTQDVSSFTLQAVSGTHTFEVRAKEKGTEIVESDNNLPSDVAGQLTTITTDLAQKVTLTEVSTKIATVQKPIFIDMHHGLLKGTGWIGENKAAQSYLSSNVTKGSITVTVTNSTDFIAGQMIFIRDFTNDQYYINKIKSISGNILTLVSKTPADFTTNCMVYTFYDNASHPQPYRGYYSIVDEIVRKPFISSKLVKTIFANEFLKHTEVTVTSTSLIDYDDFRNNYTVVFPTLNNAVYKDINNLSDKIYRFRIFINTKNSPNILMNIMNMADSTLVKTFAFNSEDGIQVAEFTTRLKAGTNRIKIYSNNASASETIELSKVEIHEVERVFTIDNLNSGKHLLLGDSWFQIEGVALRLPKYLDKAEIINFGVAGNQMNHLLNRFTGKATSAENTGGLSADIYDQRKDATTINNIKFVWVISGTNDYLNNKTYATFTAQLNELIGEIIARGAIPIVITSSIGDVAASKLDLSRQYAQLEAPSSLLEDDFKYNLDTYKTMLPINETVPANSRVVLASFYVDSTEKVRFPRIDYNAAASIQIEIGYSTSVSSTTVAAQATLTNSTSRDIAITPDVAPKFLKIILANNTAAPVTFTGGAQMVLEKIR